MSRFLFAVTVLVLVGTPAQGQTLRDAVRGLFQFGECPDLVCLSVSSAHGDHFNPAASGAQGNLVVFLTDALGASAANLPISAATTTILLEASPDGLPVRTPISAGPIYAERVQTIGKGRLFIGANVTNFNYATIRGVPLDGIRTTFTHQDTGPVGIGDPLFENDVIEVQTSMNINMLAFITSLTYGLGDRTDISVAIPLLSSTMNGSSVAQIMTFGPDGPHFFGDSANPSLRATTTAAASSVGIGDVAARVKIGLADSDTWGLAVLGDARFPTGSQANFQGSGAMAIRALGIASARYGAFSPHINGGYFFRAGQDRNDSVLLTAGFDQLLAEWATLAADLISEWQVGESTFDLPEPVILRSPIGNGFTNRVINPTNIPDQRDDVVYGSFGMKFTFQTGVTVLTNALVPIGGGGVQPELAFTAGLEYTF